MTNGVGAGNGNQGSPCEPTTTSQEQNDGDADQPSDLRSQISRLQLWVQVLTAFVAIIGLLVAWQTFRVQQFGAQLAEDQAYVTLYLDFKNNYHSQIRPFIPSRSERMAENFHFCSCTVSAFESYWYHSFDEWFASTVLDLGGQGRLWDDYYRDAIGATILKAAPRGIIKGGEGDTAYLEVLCRMLNSDYPKDFSGHREGFRNELRLLAEDMLCKNQSDRRSRFLPWPPCLQDQNAGGCTPEGCILIEIGRNRAEKDKILRCDRDKCPRNRHRGVIRTVDKLDQIVP